MIMKKRTNKQTKATKNKNKKQNKNKKKKPSNWLLEQVTELLLYSFFG